MRALLLLSLLLSLCHSVRIVSGSITMTSKTGDIEQEYRMDINSTIKNVFVLNQSSKVYVDAKITFNQSQFRPQFFAFRLRHNEYDNLTEPVLVTYNEESASYQTVIDLGDPKQIKPYSGDYRLELIIAGGQLDHKIRRYIGNCKVTFRSSLAAIPLSQLHYKEQNIILVTPTPAREDPPKLFTGFVVVVMLVLLGVFAKGLRYLKVNADLFPREAAGLVLNCVFIVAFGVVLVMLGKFWVSWTFLSTLQYILVMILPTALIANSAFVQIKKE